ncbi:hypothetical protein Tco_1084224, partial [Tanacetum coccineum]
DTSTLGVVVVRNCGYTALVKVAADVNWDGKPVPTSRTNLKGVSSYNLYLIVLHLQNQDSVKSDFIKADHVKVEPDVKGHGKGLQKGIIRNP